MSESRYLIIDLLVRDCLHMASLKSRLPPGVLESSFGSRQGFCILVSGF